MKLVNNRSLAVTLDNLNEVFFLEKNLTKTVKKEAATWIASRQGLKGSYENMFAPTPNEIKNGFRLFTGEWIKSSAATRHILGEESCRALILLDSPSKSVKDKLASASDSMLARIKSSESGGYTVGMYCCGACSASLWRHLAAGGLDDPEKRLQAGLRDLKKHRDGKGRWRRFPYYYTLLTLSEIDMKSAITEMKYAAPGCERLLKRKPGDEKYDSRRRILAERILTKA